MNPTEIKKQLQEGFPHRVELHAHTKPMSRCSSAEPKNLVELYKKLGYSALTLTNHFIYSDDETAEEYVGRFMEDYEETKSEGERIGLEVYLGAEIRFTDNNNDYLLYGANREMLLKIYDLLPNGIENFRKTYPMENSILIWAHPKRNGMAPIDPTLVDGIESLNLHSDHNSRVGKTAVMALEHNKKIVTAGTDLHCSVEDYAGISAMRTGELPEDSFGLAKLLREGDYVLEIGRNHIVLP